jgi:two-component system chemotaxis response regulator CheB
VKGLKARAKRGDVTVDKIRVLVVDDSAIYRKVITDVLSGQPEIEIVGTAANGKIALDMIEKQAPDLLTLDIEMPVMTGLELLQELKKVRSPVKAIVLSGLTHEGATATIQAMGLGALDVVLKPNADSYQAGAEELKKVLLPRVKAIGAVLIRRTRGTSQAASPEPAIAPARRRRGSYGVVTIGVSTGGPPALTRMLPKIPADLGVPILIVQHMPPMFTKSLANSLNQLCPFEVLEAEDGMTLKPGQALIAPGGKHLRVVRSGAKVITQITEDPPENACRPSVDYLFRSVAEVYGGDVLSVIMTGMGSDGNLGAQMIKNKGGTLFCQDEASCVVYGMPKALVENGDADAVFSLDKLASAIQQSVKAGRPVCI